ncbi:DUF1844 domain-containing protein [Desulfatiglans anilini]|uniref:DUF1844 domain-containing protein n=1 Tax=Desulfatiglans anilini TaxID=90728 RepID=UPI0003F93C20|nr:DUF1844 domain-containing protein [Desulfatiglans anilini]
MEEEEKGFVIKDRRAFDQQGELKEKAPAEEPKREMAHGPGAEDAGRDSGKAKKAEIPPLPPVTFSTLILSLSSSALFNLGEIPDPQSGEKSKDLQLAKHGIDTIGMLKEKTAGNLTKEEQNLLESILTDLRWRYVKAVQ